MVRTIWPSAPMRMNAFGVKTSTSPAAAASFAIGSMRLSIRPPPATAAACRMLRRERPVDRSVVVAWILLALTVMVAPLRLRGLLDGVANAHVGPAAADVAGHRIVDIGIGRTRIAGEQRCSRHDLARLAVAALHDFTVEPGLLDLGAGRGRADRLDRRDLGCADAVERGDT